MSVSVYPPEEELTIDTHQIEFNDIVHNIVNRKLREYALKEVSEINNTYLQPDLRTHFSLINISTISSSIFNNFNNFKVPRTKYKLEEFDGIEIGIEELYKNRLSFINLIKDSEDILNFIFFNFNFYCV